MRRFIVRTRCPICGDFVDEVSDKMLKKEPHYHNVEYVITHSGYKQYYHSSCWYKMIEKQKNKK